MNPDPYYATLKKKESIFLKKLNAYNFIIFSVSFFPVE